MTEPRSSDYQLLRERVEVLEELLQQVLFGGLHDLTWYNNYRPWIKQWVNDPRVYLEVVLQERKRRSHDHPRSWGVGGSSGTGTKEEAIAHDEEAAWYEEISRRVKTGEVPQKRIDTPDRLLTYRYYYLKNCTTCGGSVYRDYRDELLEAHDCPGLPK